MISAETLFILSFLQYSDRVTEVQFVYDLCGKLTRTSFIPTKNIENNMLSIQKNLQKQENPRF